MDWQKNRIWIGIVALVVVGALAFWAVQRSRRDTPVSERMQAPDFPDLAREDIASLEITRPGDQGAVRIVRREGTWWIAAPIEAEADQSAVSTALEKLDEMEVASIAASNPQFHARLEVDREHAVRVVARSEGGDVLADLWIGAYRSGNTMVRVEGQDRVVAVRGSIKFAFNRELRDWRNRSVLDVDPEQVREVAWAAPGKTFRFERPLVARESEGEGGDQASGESTTLGDWQIAEVDFAAPPPAAAEPEPSRGRGRRPSAPAGPQRVTTIEHFSPSKVRTMVSSLARMRATDFAGGDVTRESAGIGEHSPRVTLTMRDGARHTVILGAEVDAEQHSRYAIREGSDTIYVISQFLAQRVDPEASSFQQVPATPPPAGGGSGGSGSAGGEGGSAGGGGGSAGGGGGSAGGEGGAPPTIPPEVLEQLRRQIEADGPGGGP
jgi:hypothetical protein